MSKVTSSSYPPGGLVLIPSPPSPAYEAACMATIAFGSLVVTFIAAATLYIACTGVF